MYKIFIKLAMIIVMILLLIQCITFVRFIMSLPTKVDIHKTVNMTIGNFYEQLGEPEDIVGGKSVVFWETDCQLGLCRQISVGIDSNHPLSMNEKPYFVEVKIYTSGGIRYFEKQVTFNREKSTGGTITNYLRIWPFPRITIAKEKT